MDDAFKYFYEHNGFGPAINTTAPSKEVIQQFKNKLPEKLLNYWREFGFSSYGNGLLSIVNPNDYQNVLKMWLKNTPFEDKDTYYVIAQSAFGKLFIWGTSSGNSLVIDAAWGIITVNDDSEDVAKGDSGFLVEFLFQYFSKPRLDFKDESNIPLFEQALKLLGKLEPGEMYGFVPALSFGGAAELKYLKRVKSIEHLAFLAQTNDKKILNNP